MEIGEFADKTGITIDTLRYYNKIGLLVPQRNSIRRNYNQEDLEKANVIIKLKNLNFTLEELKAMFQLEKDINEDEALNNESRKKINSCLDIIKEKYDDIVRKEQDIIQTKKILEKMISNTGKLLEAGYFFKKDEE